MTCPNSPINLDAISSQTTFVRISYPARFFFSSLADVPPIMSVVGGTTARVRSATSRIIPQSREMNASTLLYSSQRVSASPSPGARPATQLSSPSFALPMGSRV